MRPATGNGVPNTSEIGTTHREVSDLTVCESKVAESIENRGRREEGTEGEVTAVPRGTKDPRVETEETKLTK